MAAHAITPGDILPYETYARERKERRARITELKRPRRVAVGPYATFYFENYATMFHQVHEMLHIERGGDEQVADELAAYNPLIPNGGELVATLMFEIDDELRRDRELRRLTGVERTMSISRSQACALPPSYRPTMSSAPGRRQDLVGAFPALPLHEGGD